MYYTKSFVSETCMRQILPIKACVLLSPKAVKVNTMFTCEHMAVKHVCPYFRRNTICSHNGPTLLEGI